MKQIVIIFFVAAAFLSLGWWLGSRQSHISNEIITGKQIDEEADSIQAYIDSIYPAYYVQGGPPDPKDYYRQRVDAWYNFRFIIKGAKCTDPRDSSLDTQNKKTDSVLSQRLGKDWRRRFENSVDSLYTIDTIAISIARMNTGINTFIRDLESGPLPDNYPEVICNPSPDPNVKVVRVKGLGVIGNDTVDVEYLRAVVDLKKKKVIEIEDIAYELIWRP